MDFSQKKNIHELIRSLILVVLLVTPFVFIPLGYYNDYFYGPKVMFYQGVVGIFLILVLVYRKETLKKVSIDFIYAFLLLYGVALVISTIFAMNPKQAIVGSPKRVEGLSTIITYMMLFVMARHAKMIKRKHIVWILIVGSIISTYGILQSFSIDPFPRDFIRENWIRAFSTIGNPNFLGSYLVLLLPLATDTFIRLKKKWALGVYALLLYTLLATMTRGAWVGAGLSHALYFIILAANKKVDVKAWLFFVVVSVGVLLVYSGLNSGFITRLLSISQDVTNIIDQDNLDHVGSSRMFIWIRGVYLVQARPLFGYGLENVGIAFLEFYKEDIVSHFNRVVIPDKAHNEYLHVALTTGLFGLMSYLMFIILIIKHATKHLWDHPLQLMVVISIIGYLIQAFFNISVVSVAYVFWIFLGLASNNHIKKDDNTTKL